MKKKDLRVVKVLSATNDDLSFIYAYEIRVQYLKVGNYENVATYFDRNKAIAACDYLLNHDNIYNCYVQKVKIWL